MNGYIIYKTLKVRIPVVANTFDEAWETAEENYNADPESYLEKTVEDKIECTGKAEPDYLDDNE